MTGLGVKPEEGRGVKSEEGRGMAEKINAFAYQSFKTTITEPEPLGKQANVPR